MEILWLFLPDEFPLVGIIAVILLYLVGLISLRTAAGAIGLFFLLLFSEPLFDILLSELPPWVFWLLVVGFAFWIFRSILALFIGQHAAEHVMASLTVDGMRMFFKLVWGVLSLPFRIFKALL